MDLLIEVAIMLLPLVFKVAVTIASYFVAYFFGREFL